MNNKPTNLRKEFYGLYRLARIAIGNIALEYRMNKRGARRFSPFWSEGCMEEILGADGSLIAKKMEDMFGVELYNSFPDNFFEENDLVIDSIKSALMSPAHDRAKQVIYTICNTESAKSF